VADGIQKEAEYLCVSPEPLDTQGWIVPSSYILCEVVSSWV